MVAQFSENIPCLRVTDNGLSFTCQNKEKELEIFYEHIIANDIDYFKISERFAQGLHKFYQRLEKSNLKNIEFIKCQITGPFTFSGSIKDERAVALLHDSILMQAILKGILMKALWQLNLFKKFGKKIILFLDEPYLGCFGSAFTPVNREDVVRELSELTANIKKSHSVLIGVHCCGNTDWSIFTDIPSIDIISFDAFTYLERVILYADNLKDFIERGGILCWGIVPTLAFTAEETKELLIKKIKDGINKLKEKGHNEESLLENLLISPSCGLGSLTEEKSEKVLEVLSETSAAIKNDF
jgi:methionine synthase II (cobalamin-independent)